MILQRPELPDFVFRDTYAPEEHSEHCPDVPKSLLEDHQVNHVLRLSPLPVLEAVGSQTYCLDQLQYVLLEILVGNILPEPVCVTPSKVWGHTIQLVKLEHKIEGINQLLQHVVLLVFVLGLHRFCELLDNLPTEFLE